MQNIHDGFSVNAIEFNPLKPALLASGGKEVYIQDISKSIHSPTVFTPGEPNYHEGNIVTSISWNRVVPYILASASNDGTVVVWDLKNSKAIFNFKDPDLLTYDFNPQNGIDEYS
jgi:protein transport protein SEC31